jgi:uncharacterized protein (DUF433 family)
MLMPKIERSEPDALSRGAYSASEALRLLNFSRAGVVRHVSRNTVVRWLQGYDFGPESEGHSEPLWRPDYHNDNDVIELSFRDLIELRFVKAFRDIGLGLPTIRACYERAAEEVHDDRPFSTQRFRTDGRTIFLEITEGLHEPKLVDLRHRQSVFRTIVEPSLKDLEFDASAVSRWYPLGVNRKSVIVDPARAFGRPISASGIPTEVLSRAVQVEGNAARVARLYDVSVAQVREAITFERKLVA